MVCESCSKAWHSLLPISLGTARLIEKILTRYADKDPDSCVNEAADSEPGRTKAAKRERRRIDG
jgi:hypothetical protein